MDPVMVWYNGYASEGTCNAIGHTATRVKTRWYSALVQLEISIEEQKYKTFEGDCILTGRSTGYRTTKC